MRKFTNEIGLRLVDSAAEMGMVIKGTYFKHKCIHEATLKSSDGVTRKIAKLFIVYILTTFVCLRR